MVTIGMLLPITYYLEPTSAIIMLAGIYYGSQYGNSTASILLNLPGTSAGAVTCIDGYPMAKSGRAGPALFLTTIASFIGSCVGIAILAGLAPTLARMALQFGPIGVFRTDALWSGGCGRSSSKFYCAWADSPSFWVCCWDS